MSWSYWKMYYMCFLQHGIYPNENGKTGVRIPKWYIPVVDEISSAKCKGGKRAGEYAEIKWGRWAAINHA
jgi:hypothetical protein